MKDAGLEVIPVRRNSYQPGYGNSGSHGNRRNVNPKRTGYQMRDRELKRTQAARSGRRELWDPRRSRALKKRQRLRAQCVSVFLGIIALTIFSLSLLLKNHRAAAAAAMDSGSWVLSGSGVGAGGGDAGGTGNAGMPQGSDGQPAGVMIQGIPAEQFARHPEWEENYLTPNEYSRPGDELKEVKNIFVHYTANPGTSAAQNRSYFERQKDEHLVSASAHFIIGYDGEIIQCVPLTEIAYAVQTRNYDSVSIECCHKEEDGSFTQETYQSLISLLAWLTDVYDLDTEDILRHYDCGGKKCPLYYTEHEDKWTQLKEDVKQMRENTGLKL